jgi:polygalacturonase
MDPNLLATYDIRDYGASITGLASPGINAAVRACAAAGGGTVFVPPGIWRCGAGRAFILNDGGYLYAFD